MSSRCVVCLDDTESDTCPALLLLPCLHVTCALCIVDLGRRDDGQPLACLECNERFEAGDPVSFITAADVRRHRDRERLAQEAAGGAAPSGCSRHGQQQPYVDVCEQCFALLCPQCYDDDLAGCTHEQTTVPLRELGARHKVLADSAAKLTARSVEVTAAREQIKRISEAIRVRHAPLVKDMDEAFAKYIAQIRNRGGPRILSRLIAGPSRAPSSIQDQQPAEDDWGNDDADGKTTTVVETNKGTTRRKRSGVWGSIRKTLYWVLSAPNDDSNTDEQAEHVEGWEARSTVENGIPVTKLWLERSRVYKIKPPALSPAQRSELESARISQIQAWHEELRETSKKTLESDVKTLTLQIEGLQVVNVLYSQVTDLVKSIHSLIQPPYASLSLKQAFGLEKVVRTRLKHFLSIAPTVDPLVTDSLRFSRFLSSSSADPMISSLDYLGRLERPRDLSSFRLVELPSFIIEANTQSQFQRPYAIACDPWNNLVVADRSLNRVVVVTPGGELRLRINATDPVSVAVGDGGNIWVATDSNDEIKCFSPTGKLLRIIRSPQVSRITIAPTNGDLILATQDCVACVTPNGELRWRSDAGDGILYGLVCTPDGELLTGSWSKQIRCLLSLDDGQQVGKIGYHFPSPSEIATTSRFFVVANPVRHNVAVHSHKGEEIHNWGSFGSRPGEFNCPGSIAILHDDRVAVADVNNARIQIF